MMQFSYGVTFSTLLDSFLGFLSYLKVILFSFSLCGLEGYSFWGQVVFDPIYLDEQIRVISRYGNGFSEYWFYVSMRQFLMLSFLLRLDSFLVSIYGEGYLSFLKASLSPSTGHLRRLYFLLLIGYFSSCQLVLLYLKLVRVLFSLRNYSSVVCIKQSMYS